MHGHARLLAYARPQGRSFALIVVLSILGSVLVTLQPWPVKLIVDSILQGQPLPAPIRGLLDRWQVAPSGAALAGWLALIGLIIAGLHVGTESWLAWQWTRAGRRMVFDLS